jgi:hypothetical protein
MRFFKKYYIYAIEFIVGNIIFNLIYTVIKTLTFQRIGAVNETFFKNIIGSFKETIIVYIIVFVLSVIAQVLYDNYLIKKLNNKLKKTKERG